MGRRTKARECALQMLYQKEATGDSMAAVAPAFWKVRTTTDETRAIAERLARGTESRLEGVDEAIVGASRNWRFDRIAAVDKSILRLGAYELMHEQETPAAVVIDEAVEMAKRFGDADSPAFVNGILDAIKRKARP
jgi:N utilization substance protein B